MILMLTPYTAALINPLLHQLLIISLPLLQPTSTAVVFCGKVTANSAIAAEKTAAVPIPPASRNSITITRYDTCSSLSDGVGRGMYTNIPNKMLTTPLRNAPNTSAV